MAELAHDASGAASPEAVVNVLRPASGPASSDKGKLRVFISYSRDDLKFADQLDAALNAYGFECLIDRHGISGGEDWKRRLGNLISEADTVVFVLSPSSARSEICAWEVEEAARLNKRILPVMCRQLEALSPPLRLRDLNYIFFYEEPNVPGSGFGTGLANLVTALNTDFDWLREHTRYLQRAIEWDKGGRPANRLLSGNDIVEAKAWAARRPKGAPEPTALHLNFIRMSEEEAEARLADQRKQLEAVAAAQAARETALHEAEKALRQAAVEQRKRAKIRNTAFVAVSAVAAFALYFAWLFIGQRDVARQETQRADAFINLVDTNPAGRRAMEKICAEAINVTSTLATTSDGNQLADSLGRFWELYYGPMYIIEIHQTKKEGRDSEIELSMVDFGRAIEKATEPLPLSSLCPRAKAVRDNCIAYLKVAAPEPCG
jgi:hypothetical protein